MFSSGSNSLLDLALNSALRRLNALEPETEEYAKTLEAVVTLHKLKEEERPSPISKDALLNVGANLLGILMIIKHERMHIITSKAFGLLPRLMR